MLPKARVVYCSATGVTDVKNMVSQVTWENIFLENEQFILQEVMKDKYKQLCFRWHF